MMLHTGCVINGVNPKPPTKYKTKYAPCSIIGVDLIYFIFWGGYFTDTLLWTHTLKQKVSSPQLLPRN